jgi:hypothetical protein
MAGSIVANRVVLGDSATSTQNFELRTNVDGTMKLARGATGALGDVLTVDSNGIVAAPAGRNFLTLGTAQNTTSGTNIDFTGIPSWAKRITLMYSGVSTNGTDGYLLQLGTSGSFETTNYSGSVARLADAGAVAVSRHSSTTGFVFYFNMAATDAITGAITLTLMDSATNRWIVTGNSARVDGTSLVNLPMSGEKALAGLLTRLRLTTSGGVNTFDAGSVNILIEG